MCVCVCGGSGEGGLSAGAIPDVAMIRGRGRFTLTLTTIWRCVLSSMGSNGSCGAEKRAVKMSFSEPIKVALSFSLKILGGKLVFNVTGFLLWLEGAAELFDVFDSSGWCYILTRQETLTK